MNYRLTIAYDGTDFHGWQMQGAALRTVQGDLTHALSLISGQKDVVVHGAGRTDAGVHAEGQVANSHLHREFTPEKLRSAINGNLKRDVRVTEVAVVPDDFHARFSACGKTYCYRIFNEPFISPFWVRYAHHEARFLDITRMQQAARAFLGEHDWTAFSSAHADASSRVRTITQLEVKERLARHGKWRLLEITASADGFLRYMMRSIAGTLLAVGRDQINLAEITNAIENGDRALAGATAPACGLSLIKVHYNEEAKG